MKFRVYHTKDWEINSNLHFVKKDVIREHYRPDPDQYKLVAIVECDALGSTFPLTNHIDREWWLNDGVQLVEESRSTSIGDVVEDENGQVFLCCSVGWEEVSWKE
jgi:hypothetical protein